MPKKGYDHSDLGHIQADRAILPGLPRKAVAALRLFCYPPETVANGWLIPTDRA